MTGTQPTQAGWVDRVAAAYGRGRPVAVLFDYDGTLTPLVRHPSLARLASRTRDQLGRLADLPEVGVGVISGRALHDVRALVGLGGVYYAGSGGLEMDLLGDEERYPQTDAIGQLLDGIQDHLLDLLEMFPGTWLERKPGAITLHFRGLLPLAATCFRYEAVRLLSAVEELRCRVVSEAVELTPADGWDKGTAVETILAHMADALASPPLVVYFGDAANDTEGMAVATRTGGVCVGVGSDAPPIAELRLANPAELAECLDELTARLAAHRGLSVFKTHSPPKTPVELNAEHGETHPAGSSVPKPGLLLLDSDDRARTELATGMTAQGWRVWQADTVVRAFELLERHGAVVHVALVDLQLPGLQGARTLAEFGQTRPDLIRCFLSADISPYMATAFGKLSDVPLFVKPLRPADADRLFRLLLGKKRLACK
jgi:trehalose 6-phosphate phosphatase